eukprot:scaffold60730_cov75-Phaeocystis_antarctica.AAC.3
MLHLLAREMHAAAGMTAAEVADARAARAHAESGPWADSTGAGLLCTLEWRPRAAKVAMRGLWCHRQRMPKFELLRSQHPGAPAA